MTRIDFYLCDQARPDAKLRTACQIADKAYRLGHRVYLYTPDETTSTRLDDMLWTFAAGAFVPHRRDVDSDDGSPVIIGHGAPSTAEHDVLVSLVPSVPDFFSRFSRLADVVSADPDDRDAARERYRHYRERGYPLETHNL